MHVQRSMDATHSAETNTLHLQDANSELVFGNLNNDQIDSEVLRKLLLTEATGFLGIHILSEALTADAEVHIYCLVRAQDKKQGMDRLRVQAEKFELKLDESRISILCGDVNQPNLGLSQED